MDDLLFLAQRIPFPPTKGEKIRYYEFLKHLSTRFSVHLGCLIDDPEDWAHTDAVRDLCTETHFAPLNRSVAKSVCLMGLVTGEALSVRFFRNRGLQTWVDDVMTRVKPAVVMVCSGNVAPYVLGRPDRDHAIIVDLCDVDSEKWHEYARGAGVAGRLIYGREARYIRALEREIARTADAVTLVSHAEAGLLGTFCTDDRDRIVAVGNGVNFAYFDGSLVLPRVVTPGTDYFVFTGTMDYRPNIDAVAWFADEVFPTVRQAVPNALFYIVGSNPVPRVRALAERDGIVVTGRVADVRPYLAYCTASVAPLQIARGVQNKVLEAMAMGRACIVTPQALEGIEADSAQEVVVADEAQAFAAAAIALAGDPARARRIGTAAARRIRRDYAWSHRLAALDRVIEGARDRAARIAHGKAAHGGPNGG